MTSHVVLAESEEEDEDEDDIEMPAGPPPDSDDSDDDDDDIAMPAGPPPAQAMSSRKSRTPSRIFFADPSELDRFLSSDH